MLQKKMSQKKKFFCWRNRIYILLLFLLCCGMVTDSVYAMNVLRLEGKATQSKTILLEWESQSVEHFFEIHKSIDGGSTYEVLATMSGQAGVIKCYDQHVTMGKTYYYKLLEKQGEEIVGESNVIKVKAALATPAKCKADVIKNSRVRITWSKVKGAAFYTVYRSTKCDKGFKKITDTKKASYVDYDVRSGKCYYYKIVANHKRNKNWKSLATEVVRAYMKPSAPDVMGTYTKKKVRLTWKKVRGAQCYYVYKKNKKGKFEKVKETKKLYYNDSSVKKGKRYTYKVVAVGKVDSKMIKGEQSKICEILASEIDPKKKMIALTYDDGPSQYTTDILRCLKENNARATFFVLGCNVDAHKDVVAAANKMGCEIGNHTYTHPMLTRRNTEQIREELDSTDKKIKRITGHNAVVMRPPGGDVNEPVANIIGKPIILWSIDTRDWEHRNSSRTIQNVINNVKDGDIILMHDIYSATRDASLTLIPQLRRMGYQMVTVSELAQYRNVSMKKGGIYRSFRE